MEDGNAISHALCKYEVYPSDHLHFNEILFGPAALLVLPVKECASVIHAKPVSNSIPNRLKPTSQVIGVECFGSDAGQDDGERGLWRVGQTSQGVFGDSSVAPVHRRQLEAVEPCVRCADHFDGYGC